MRGTPISAALASNVQGWFHSSGCEWERDREREGTCRSGWVVVTVVSVVVVIVLAGTFARLLTLFWPHLDWRMAVLNCQFLFVVVVVVCSWWKVFPVFIYCVWLSAFFCCAMREAAIRLGSWRFDWLFFWLLMLRTWIFLSFVFFCVSPDRISNISTCFARFSSRVVRGKEAGSLYLVYTYAHTNTHTHGRRIALRGCFPIWKDQAWRMFMSNWACPPLFAGAKGAVTLFSEVKPEKQYGKKTLT